MTKEELKAELNVRFNEILLAGYGSEDESRPLNALLDEHKGLVADLMKEDFHLRSKGMAVGSMLIRSVMWDLENKSPAPVTETRIGAN